MLYVDILKYCFYKKSENFNVFEIWKAIEVISKQSETNKFSKMLNNSRKLAITKTLNFIKRNRGPIHKTILG